MPSTEDKSDKKLNPFTLGFQEKDIEEKYQDYYIEGFLFQFRTGTILAAFIYLFFYLLDIIIIPSIIYFSLIIRIFVFIFCLMIFALSFTDLFKAKAQFFIFMLSLLGAFGIILMIALSNDAYAYTYYAGLIMAILCSILVFRIRFITSFFIALFIFLGYEFFTFNKNYTIEIIASNNFFLTTGVLLSLFTCYFLERYDRTVFLKEGLEARLRERGQAIERIFNLIHSGPLQTLSNIIRYSRNQEIDKEILDKLIYLNQEIRSLNAILTQEIIDENNLFYLGGGTKIDLLMPLDELLYEVYSKTLEREFDIFETIKLKVPSFVSLPNEDGFSREMRRDICLFVEEALCNVGKHAIGSTKLYVKGSVENNHYLVQVIDNGNSPEIESLGKGTEAMKIIASRWNGNFNRTRLEPKGMLCELDIPFHHQ